MASFTGVGDTVELVLRDKDEEAAIAISGTYNMTILLQRAVTSDRSAWETIESWSTANDTVAYTYKTDRYNEVLRLIVDVDTSGTAVATLTDSLDKSIHTLTDGVGTVLAVWRQSGVTFEGNVITKGSNSFSGEDAAQGAAVAITGGDSSTSANAGGAVNTTGGTPGATGIGGAVVLTGGVGGSTSGAGGAAKLVGGASTAGNSAGGASEVTGGAGQGTAAGGAIVVTSGGSENGTAVSPGASGAISLVVGAAGTATTGTAGAGGAIAITGAAGGLSTGAASTAGAGSSLTATAGAGGASSGGSDTGGAGGNITITPGAGGSGATAGVGGHVFLRDQNVFKKQGAPTAKTTTAAITAAELLTGIITTTGASAPSSHQLPTGTLLKAAIGAGIAADDSFDFTVINTGTGASDDATLTVNTDVTIVGNPTVGSLTDGTIISGSGRFRARFTTGTTFIVYRLA